MKSIDIKCELLSKGIQVSQDFINNYGPEFLEKRRAYGNPDPKKLLNERIPQELYINPEEDRLICAVNVNDFSEWNLIYKDNQYWVSDNTVQIPVSFPLRPDFYDYDFKSRNVNSLSQVVTLYGGGSLGIFAYGTCYLVELNKPCAYCSVPTGHDPKRDFLYTITPEQAYEAVKLALSDTEAPLSQIMLNGGNFSDMDKSFMYYVSILKRILDAVEESGLKIEVHLIVYPPQNLDLLEALKGMNVCVAMNTEVYDPELFEEYCPGKVEIAGREHMFNALAKAIEVLGKGRVFSILVGGLESVDSLSEGLQFLANMGVTPVINVLHTDPNTPLEKFPNPTPDKIKAMGEQLQRIYKSHDFKPFYLNCGRNSIDTEAFKGLFV